MTAAIAAHPTKTGTLSEIQSTRTTLSKTPQRYLSKRPSSQPKETHRKSSRQFQHCTTMRTSTRTWTTIWRPVLVYDWPRPWPNSRRMTLRTSAVRMCEDSHAILARTSLHLVSQPRHGRIKKEALIRRQYTITIISSNSWIGTKTIALIPQRRTIFSLTLSLKVNTTTTIKLNLAPR